MNDTEQPQAQEEEPLTWSECWGTTDDYRRMLPILEEAEDIATNISELLNDVDDDVADHALKAARALYELIPLIWKRTRSSRLKS